MLLEIVESAAMSTTQCVLWGLWKASLYPILAHNTELFLYCAYKRSSLYQHVRGHPDVLEHPELQQPKAPKDWGCAWNMLKRRVCNCK